jgi:hypothetical protein
LRFGTLGLLAVASAACLVGTDALAFHIWRTETLHHTGFVLVGAAMPWVGIAGQLDLLRGYWAPLIALWLGLSVNLTLVGSLSRWSRSKAKPSPS